MNIFVSYSWRDENIANDLDEKFRGKEITIIRDKRELKFKDSLSKFMKKIRETDYVFLIISKEYLESDNCLYEICELIKDENFKNRILPIVNSNSGIFKAEGRAKYIKYWEEKYKQLEEVASKTNPVSNSDINEELTKILKIKIELPGFLKSISDMIVTVCENVLTNDNFREIASFLDLNFSILDICENFMVDVRKYSSHIEYGENIDNDILSRFEKKYIEQINDEGDKFYFFEYFWTNTMGEKDIKVAMLLYHILHKYINENQEFCIKKIEVKTDTFVKSLSIDKVEKEEARESSGYIAIRDGFSRAFHLFFDFPELFNAFDDDFKLDFKIICKCNINYYLLAYFCDSGYEEHLKKTENLLKEFSQKDKHSYWGDYTRIDIRAFLKLFSKLKNNNFSFEKTNSFILNCIISRSSSYGYSESVLEDLIPEVIDYFSFDDMLLLIKELDNNSQYYNLGGNDYGKSRPKLWDYIRPFSEDIINILSKEYIQNNQDSNSYILKKLGMYI